jgi:hypothetical protein
MSVYRSSVGLFTFLFLNPVVSVFDIMRCTARHRFLGFFVSTNIVASCELFLSIPGAEPDANKIPDI